MEEATQTRRTRPCGMGGRREGSKRLLALLFPLIKYLKFTLFQGVHVKSLNVIAQIKQRT